MPAAPVVRILERIARQPTAPLHEHAVLDEAARIARSFGASVRTDRWGNLILAPAGRRPGPALWLVAHTDHPGFEITGPRRAAFLGGVKASYFHRGLPVRFYRDGEVIHARLDRYAPSAQRLSLQDGPGVRRLRRGDFGVFEVEDFRLAGGRVHARQLDDLAGSAVALAVMERVCRSRRLNVRALLTRAEEVGFVGSLGAAADRRIPRDAWIVNVEASRALPGVEIGGGPVIRVGDRTSTFDGGAEALLQAARKGMPRGKPVQRFLMSGGTCEATVWNLYGYRATGVAIPLGNYHNQGPGDRIRAETVSARDLATAVDLLERAGRQARQGPGRGERLRRRVEGYLARYGGRLQASRTAPPTPGNRIDS